MVYNAVHTNGVRDRSQPLSLTWKGVARRRWSSPLVVATCHSTGALSLPSPYPPQRPSAVGVHIENASIPSIPRASLPTMRRVSEAGEAPPGAGAGGKSVPSRRQLPNKLGRARRGVTGMLASFLLSVSAFLLGLLHTASAWRRFLQS